MSRLLELLALLLLKIFKDNLDVPQIDHHLYIVQEPSLDVSLVAFMKGDVIE